MDIENQEQEQEQKVQRPSFVYLLYSSDEQNTYVGATMDVDHRLRQHNQEIKGGAVYTARKVKQGQTWSRVCYVSGFPNWQAALQFEWRWKQISRKNSNKNPLLRRMFALNELLSLKQSTSKAIPYVDWVNPPKIHFTTTDHEALYHKITTTKNF
jgi:structure-specific endonuclease subunit SLX1